MQEPSHRDIGEGRGGWKEYERIDSITAAGVRATACRQRRPGATGETANGDRTQSTGSSRETGRAVWGGGEVRSPEEAESCRRREGTSVKDERRKQRGQGD